MEGEGKREFKQEILNGSLRNSLKPNSTRSHCNGCIVVVRLNLGRRKRIEREEKDTNNRNNHTVLSDSCA